ncbi:hypothetical protein Cgig2_024394 [Carnegiea gigantea]|uniref:Uncharacterized protein n=1 Tax=Carnegiea gigantea TaxID=171969 RepID=A0A9Q1JND7_9CARY|nr:hypothetical protein Cgig2_024394 [Carnegiea gigantea]
MTSITRVYRVVLTDTRVGSRNAQRLLNEAHHLNYYYREPVGFIGGIAILWNNSKVEVCGYTGHFMDMSCIVKVRTPVNHLTLSFEICPFINLGFTSDSSESDFTCDCCAMETYTCNCGLDADIFEGDGQYRQWYARCPKREVIDDLVREHALEKNWVLDDRNAQLWSREEDMCMEAEHRAEVNTLRKFIGVAVVAIAILLAFCIRWM